MKKLTTLKPKKTKTIEVKSEAKSTSWYDYPQYYDLGFRDNSKLETKFFEAAFERFVPGKVKRVLEPGCGTGRLVFELAKLGYQVTGLDLNAKALGYCQKRLHRRGLDADLVVGDMTDFSFPEKFDAAINPLNTFRHLTTEAQAVKHLKLVAQHLRPGGIYILGLHLLPPDADLEGTERWTVKQGKTKATFSLSVIDSSRRTRIENLKITMNIHRPSGKIRLVDEFPLRMYSASQIKSLFAKVPEFKLHSTYDFWYEIDEPQTLNNDLVDSVFVLQKT